MNIEAFTTLWINSQLNSQQEAQLIADVFQGKCRKWYTPASVELFCGLLIDTNRLTAWQCDNLQKGRWKGFYLENYLLLEQIGKDQEFGYYKARHTRDGALVTMAVTPVNRATGPGIEYRVQPYAE